MTEDEIFGVIETYVISLELARYYEVSPAIGDIPSNVADLVAKQLADFQDVFSIHFDKEKYLKAELAIEYAKRKMYDTKKYKVGKYQQGAFGIRVQASDDAIVKYVFNVCMSVCARDFRILGELTR